MCFELFSDFYFLGRINGIIVFNLYFRNKVFESFFFEPGIYLLKN